MVTNAGLMEILSLPNLESLCMVFLENITDDVFDHVPNLIHLNCAGCNNVGDAGLIRLIQSSVRLESLHIVGCRNVTNKLVNAAIHATAKRVDNVILEIRMEGSGIDLKKVKNTSPFLRVLVSI